MRGVLGSAAIGARLLPIGSLVYVVLLLLLPSGVLAQSSVGRAANAATGQSLRDAVEQNQKEFIDREALGSSAGGGGVALGTGASPSGRLRTSDHDALRNVSPTDTENFAWSTKEASAFATVVYAMPGTVLGGQVKLSFLGGHNWLSLEMKEGGGNTFSPDQFGKARNESVLFGGTALWAKNSSYVVATLVGMWGETSLSDAIDFCGPCVLRRYEFDTSGFTGSLTAGNVFALSKSPSGPMLDLRGSVGYTQNIGDGFFNFRDDMQKYKFSTWTVTGSATLFANIATQNSALLRPYIQGYVRQEIGYRNKLQFDLAPPNTDEGYVHWDQAHTYGGVDAGLTYTQGNMTLGAAVYFDASADEQTLGGRIGASWKLN